MIDCSDLCKRILTALNRPNRSFGHIGVVLSQCLACLRTKTLCGVFHGLFSNNEILYTLAPLLPDTEFCLRDWIYFQGSRGSWFVKAHLSGVLSSIGTENASETRFQTPKLDHANAPNNKSREFCGWVWIKVLIVIGLSVDGCLAIVNGQEVFNKCN